MVNRLCKKEATVIIGIFLFLVISSIHNIFLFAQQGPDLLWTKTYGYIFDDWAHSVHQTIDGGYIIAGTQGSGVYLIKTDVHGDSEWTKSYSGLDSRGYSVQQTIDGGYVITGQALPVSLRAGDDAYLIKTNSQGEKIWSKVYSGEGEYPDCGYSVHQTIDGGYIITGAMGTNSNGEQIYIIKTDSLGDSVWTKSYGDSNDDCGYDIQLTTDGGYIITGSTFADNVDVLEDVCLIKTNDKGDTSWTKHYGGMNTDIGYSVQLTDDGGYIISGYTTNDDTTSDVYLVKTDRHGEKIWAKTYGALKNDFGYSVQQTSDGGYIIAGSIMSTDAVDSADVYLIKTDELGDIIWTATYGGPEADRGYSVEQTSDGGYIIAGYTGSFGAGSHDVYLIKTKPIIALVSPNGGEILQGGSSYTITWIPENKPIGRYYFQLFFSHDGGMTYSDTIGQGLGNEVVSYVWDVPLINSNGCRIKLQLVDAYGDVIAEEMSNTNFTIDMTVPIIDSTTIWNNTSSPGPFEVLTKVTDNLAGVDSVLLFYQRNEDTDWNCIVMSEVGASDWFMNFIPAVIFSYDSVRYYIKAYDGAGNLTNDPDAAPNNYYSFIVDFTGIEENHEAPKIFSFNLKANPIKNRAIFNLSMPTDGFVLLQVYDVMGRLVDTPINGLTKAGVYDIFWHTKTSAGVYFYRFRSSWQNKTGKLIFVR